MLGEATILKRLGDNDYLAEYNGVKCHAIFNSLCRALLCRRCVRRDPQHARPGQQINDTAHGQVTSACPYLPERRKL